MRAGVYLRISVDDGNQTATDRQHDDALQFIASQGWEVAEVFEDVGISAYKLTKERPAFERMIKAIVAGEIDVVVAYHLDRLSRRLLPFAQLMEACDRHGAFIVTTSDRIDTRTESGKFVATLLAGHAKMSSADTARRVRRKHEELVKEGRPILGRRAYGYNQRRTDVVPHEAALIREALERILAGEGLNGVAFDFARRGITTPKGRPWTAKMLRETLRSPGLSGQREHQGVLTPGCWPAIVTPAETMRLRQTLANRPSMLTTGRSPKRYLLCGFLRCGLCGHELLSGPSGRGLSRYACRKRPNTENCGRLARAAVDVDNWVRDSVIEMLDSDAVAEYLHKPSGAPSDALVAAIRADEVAMDDLSRTFWNDRLISKAEFFAAREPLNARLEANRLALAKVSRRGLLAMIAGKGKNISSEWNERGLEWQRAVIATVVDHITIQPHGLHAPRAFRPEMVQIKWKF